MAKQKNQYDYEPMIRKLAEISYDTTKLRTDDITDDEKRAGFTRSLVSAYNSVVQAARRFAAANQSVKLYPGKAQSDAQRSTIVDLTGPDADKLVEALGLELNEATSKTDKDMFNDALTITSRDQTYHTIRARLDEAFIKKLKGRFLESGTEFQRISDDGLYEIAVPEGAMVSGAGKNHARRVTAWSAMRLAVSGEQERARKEREQEKDFIEATGIGIDEYNNMPKKEKQHAQTAAARKSRQDFYAANPEIRQALIESSIALNEAWADDIKRLIRANPRLKLPDADLRKLDTAEKTLRRLVLKADAAEDALDNPDEIRRARIAELKKRRLVRDATEEYYNDPANINDPYVQERLLRLKNATNREERKKLLELERTPGTHEYRQHTLRRLALGDIDADEKEKIVNEYVKKNPKSRLAKEMRAAKKKARRERDARLKQGVQQTNKFFGSMFLSFIGTLITTIGLVAVTAVKILAAVLKIKDVVRDNATQAQTYALTEAQMKKYSHLEKALNLPPGTYASIFGSIQGKLSNIEGGGIDSWVSNFALLSRHNNNNAVLEGINYARHLPGTSVEKVFKAAFNDAFIAAYNRKTGVFDEQNFSRALATNASAASAADPRIAQVVISMGEWFAKLATSEVEVFNKVAAVAKPGGDPYQALEDHIVGVPVKIDEALTPGAILSRAEEVAKTFDKLRVVFEAIRDGILVNILAAVEPLAGYLQLLLKYFLSFLNNFKIGPVKFPTYGMFTETIVAMNEDIKAKNDANKLLNDARLQEGEIILSQAAKEMGYDEGADLTKLAGEYARTGVIRRGDTGELAPVEQAAHFYQWWRVVKRSKDLDESFVKYAKKWEDEGPTSAGYALVTNASALDVGRQTTEELRQEIHETGMAADQVFMEVLREPGGQEYFLPNFDSRKRDAERRIIDADRRLEFLEENLPDDKEGIEEARDERDHWRSILENIHAAEAFLPAVLGNDGVYTPGEAAIISAGIASKERDEIAAELTVLEHITQGLGLQTVTDHLRNNTLYIKLEMDDAKKEVDINVYDKRDNRLLGNFQTIINTIMKEIKFRSDGFGAISVDYRGTPHLDPQHEAKERREAREQEERRRRRSEAQNSNQQGTGQQGTDQQNTDKQEPDQQGATQSPPNQ